MLPNVLGALIIGLPLLLLVAILLRRQPGAIRGFAVAMILIGTGYLIATGAAGDIGRSVLGAARDASQAGKAGAPAPAPAK